MSKGVKFNVILSINGKDVVVQCKQGVQELGKALGTIPGKAEQGRQSILKWAGISVIYNNLYSGLQQLTGAMQPFIAKSNAATEAQTADGKWRTLGRRRGQMPAYRFLDGMESQGVPIIERDMPGAIEEQVVKRAGKYGY